MQCASNGNMAPFSVNVPQRQSHFHLSRRTRREDIRSPVMKHVELTSDEETLARKPPQAVQWSNVTKIHIMGICGSAMGAFAGMLRARGFEVRGSDAGAYPPMSTTLSAMGVPIMEGYRPENLSWGPDVVIVGNVIHPGYSEAVAMRAAAIPHASLPQALSALFITDQHSVVISGTHGKTTTSSMTAWLLHEAGLDPGFMIGGVTGNLGTNHRIGGGTVFVVEGDEYDTAYFDKNPKFLHYQPRTASVNNIEFDHADIYQDVAAIEAQFRKFVGLIPADGRLLLNAHNPRSLNMAKHTDAPIWRFGTCGDADIRASDLRCGDHGTRFTLHLPDHESQDVTLPLWGSHNLENALTATGLALAAGADARGIVRGLETFRLPIKRHQLKGVADGVPVVDDFAHHPTAILKTIEATRERWPGRRVIALFEVESNTSRRRVFQDAFAHALSTADMVFFCSPLTKSDNLAPHERLDMDGLIAGIRRSGVTATLLEDLDQLAQLVVGEAVPGEDVILAMSGRDFHGIHDQMLSLLEERAAGRRS